MRLRTCKELFTFARLKLVCQPIRWEIVDGRVESPLATCGPFTDSYTVDWDTVDAEFSATLSPVHQRPASNYMTTSEAAGSFPALFKAHLERYEILPTPGTYYSTSKVLHHTRKLERLVKKLLPRNIQQIPGEFHCIIRIYNKALKSLNHCALSKNLWRHEKAFKSNPWTYKKKLCLHISS